MTKSAVSQEQPDFSLVLGGPLFQIFRRIYLSGDELELLRRRLVTIICVTWVPPLFLSVFSGFAVGDGVAIPFLYDIEVHVRFLIALPILIAAELVVHQRIRPIVAQFIERRLIPEEEMPKFRKAIKSTLRLRNSVIVEGGLVVLVYTFGLWVWRNQIALGSASWYAIHQENQMSFTPAGYWFHYISVPIFQFILLRWYLRFSLWFWFLFRVSRLNLQLVSIHPDKAAGLGFLSTSIEAFSPILVAQGALLAGLMASQIFFAGKSFMDFKVQMIGFLSFFISAMLIPLTVFTPALAQVKRQGRLKFGSLANLYVRDFQEKWIGNSEPTNEVFLGNADIQSLADLGNSFSFVRDMRLVPFGVKDVAMLIGITAFPFLPLTLTTFSLEQLANHLIKAIF